MPRRAVIFDCDGTLVDSEPLSRRAWERAVRPFGYEVTAEDLAACLGRDYAFTHSHFAARAPLPGPDGFWPLLTGELFPILDSELTPFADAVSAAHELAALDVPMAVASSSSRERLARTLARAEMPDSITVTIAGDEVSRGKPAPDMFLAAARRLGVAPDRCVVVEDSPAGVQAGLSAGMVCVAVARDSRDAPGLSHADVVLAEVTAGSLLSAQRAPRRVAG